jgi:hypothetical protein
MVLAAGVGRGGGLAPWRCKVGRRRGGLGRHKRRVEVATRELG